jgi:sulfonate transport system substrate-binding protein
MRTSGRTMLRLLAAAVLFSLFLGGCSQKESGLPAARHEADLCQDPLYATYRFGEQGIIDFGIQPLTLPEGAVTELISRDRTLAARLQATGQVLRPFSFYKGADVSHFMSKGQLEGGVFGDMPALVAAASGQVVVAAMLKQGFASIIARRPMLVKELEGKRVATGLGSAAHFTLLNALQNEGLSERDLQLIGMDVNDMPQALAEGKIDAFCAWEPTPVLALAQHPEFRLIHKGLSYAFLCFRRDFAASHPAEVREILASVARSCLWMRLPGRIEQVALWNRDSASGLLGKPFPLQTEQMVAITRDSLLNIPISPQIPPRLLREGELLWKKFEFLKKTGAIAPNTPWEKIRGAFAIDELKGVLADGKGYALDRFDYRDNKLAGGAK